MKLSEAIKKLQAFKKEVGDVELVVVTDVDGGFIIEERELDIIQFPADDGEPEETVVAFLETFENDGGEGEPILKAV